MTKLELSITEQMDYETFVQIISNIPSCIFYKDRDLKYRFSSHCWAQLNSDDINGKTDLDIRKDKENAIKAMEADQAIIESGKGAHYVIKSDIDGDISYLELIKEPIFDSAGGVIGIVGLINDVTEKTIMEKQITDMSNMLEIQCKELEKSNSELKETVVRIERMIKTQKLFTASMNHELRSPLNGIIGNLQLLMEDSELKSYQLDQIKNAYFSSQLLLEIVNELLDYAKLEMSNFSVVLSDFSISDILDNIKIYATTQCQQKSLEFVLSKSDDLPEYFRGDKNRITQIIHNLVSNAIKYTEKGRVTLSVSYADGRLNIVCADTGQGMSEEALQTIFVPFVRFNEENNVSIQGTGLGMSVVKKIVDLMNGEINITSQINRGSTFTVTLPLEALAASNLKSVETSINASPKLEGMRVLCIDDSRVNTSLVSSILAKLDVITDEALTSEDGIKKADQEKYDVILLDHMMPGRDGLETFDQIRSSSRFNKATPVIMLTGNSGAFYDDLYRSKGIDHWLVKPIMKEDLLDTILSVMSDNK